MRGALAIPDHGRPDRPRGFDGVTVPIAARIVTRPSAPTRIRVEVVVKADALQEPTENLMQLFDATGPYGPLRFKDGSAEAFIYDH